MLVGFVSRVFGSWLQSTSRQEQNGCTGCWFSTLSVRLSKSRVWTGLTGLASQKDLEQQAELEHGFLARQSQEKNNPVASDTG